MPYRVAVSEMEDLRYVDKGGFTPSRMAVDTLIVARFDHFGSL